MTGERKLTYDKSKDISTGKEFCMKPSKEDKKNSESHFVLEGNAFYEIDEECVKKRRRGQKTRPVSKKRR